MTRKKRTSVIERAEAYDRKLKEDNKAAVINYMRFAGSVYNNAKLDNPDLSFKEMIKSDEFKERFKDLNKN